MSDEDLRELERAAAEAAPAVMRYFRALERVGKLPVAPHRREEAEEIAVLRRMVTIMPRLDTATAPGQMNVALDPDVRRLADALYSLFRGAQGPPGAMGREAPFPDVVESLVAALRSRSGQTMLNEAVRHVLSEPVTPIAAGFRALAKELETPATPTPPAPTSADIYAAEQRARPSFVASGAPEPPTAGMFISRDACPRCLRERANCTCPCPICGSVPACTQDCR